MPGKKLAAQPLTFKVVFEPDADGWHVVIPTVPGCHTWGQSLGQARRNIREALATCADQFDDPDQVAASAVFEERLKLPAEVKAAMRGYQRARLQATREAERLRQSSANAARALTEKFSLRDAGELLGMSQEGVRKILKTG
jgi:predicted RNase H-like HicB family nuclease